MASLNPSEFNDEALLRLSGLKWTDFIEFANGDRQGGVLFWNQHSATLSVQTRYPVMSPCYGVSYGLIRTVDIQCYHDNTHNFSFKE